MAGVQSHLSFMIKDEGQGTRLLLIGKMGSTPRGQQDLPAELDTATGGLGGAPRSRLRGRGRVGAKPGRRHGAASCPQTERASPTPPRPTGQGRL